MTAPGDAEGTSGTTIVAEATSTSTSGSQPSSTDPLPTTGTSTSTSTSDDTMATFGDEASSVFIRDPDGNSVCGPAPEGASFYCGCSLFDQDCPRGEKCTPWANNGSDRWNAARCSAVDPDPAAPGEPCTVEGSPASGLDSCVVGSMCWRVDPDTLEGECVAFCEHSEFNPICSIAGTDCMIANDSALALCLPICDPLAAMPCEAGDSCHPIDGTWLCLPDGAPIDIGNLTPTLCPSGSTAVDPASQSFCDPEQELCCAQICDVTAPSCTPPLDCVAVGESGNAGLCVD